MDSKIQEHYGKTDRAEAPSHYIQSYYLCMHNTLTQDHEYSCFTATFISYFSYVECKSQSKESHEKNLDIDTLEHLYLYTSVRIYEHLCESAYRANHSLWFML